MPLKKYRRGKTLHRINTEQKSSDIFNAEINIQLQNEHGKYRRAYQKDDGKDLGQKKGAYSAGKHYRRYQQIEYAAANGVLRGIAIVIFLYGHSVSEFVKSYQDQKAESQKGNAQYYLKYP